MLKTEKKGSVYWWATIICFIIMIVPIVIVGLGWWIDKFKAFF